MTNRPGENILNPNVAIISFNAPPISSIISANSAGNPVSASWRASIATTSRFLAAPMALMSLVASTTWELMDAMAEVKVVPAAALSASEEEGVREAAVESMLVEVISCV